MLHKQDPYNNVPIVSDSHILKIKNGNLFYGQITRQLLAASWDEPEAYHHAVLIKHCTCILHNMNCMNFVHGNRVKLYDKQ